MKWDEPKREKSDFFEDFTKEEETARSDADLEARSSFPQRKPQPKTGPHWEVDETPSSDFVNDFFKPA